MPWFGMIFGPIMMIAVLVIGAMVGLALSDRREKACCPLFAVNVALQGPKFSLEIQGPADASRLLDLLFRRAEPPVVPTA